jgi:hypothetical protein
VLRSQSDTAINFQVKEALWIISHATKVFSLQRGLNQWRTNRAWGSFATLLQSWYVLYRYASSDLRIQIVSSNKCDKWIGYQQHYCLARLRAFLLHVSPSMLGKVHILHTARSNISAVQTLCPTSMSGVYTWPCVDISVGA